MSPRNLAIARAGDDSKHETWLSNPSKKNFDLLVAYYGDTPGRFKDRADIYHVQKGLKYPWFNAYLDENPSVFEYDAVWLCDDDVEADTETVADMFDIFHDKGLGLAQPALTTKSFIAFRVLQMRRGLLLHYTKFVEEQQPVFSKEHLRKLRGTFGINASGWGLSIVWVKLMGYAKDKIAIIDATPTGHYRPHGSGPMYKKVLLEMGINPHNDLARIRQKHGNPHDTTILSEIPLNPSDPMTPVRLNRQKRT